LKHEIQIMAYVISHHTSKFLDLLEDALKRDVKTVIIPNKFEEQSFIEIIVQNKEMTHTM